MKFVRWGDAGYEKPGLIDAQGRIKDLSGIVDDISAATLHELSALKAVDETLLRTIDEGQRLGVCISGIRNIYCIGLNYTDHAEEMGLTPPEEPLVFSKATSALSGPYDPIILPDGSQKTDYEIELAVVIGQEAYNIPKAVASSCIAGYCIANDVSERTFQLECGGQYIKGKSAPTFCPLGPWLVTPDEIEDVQDLSLKLRVNGDLVQDSNTSHMVLSITEIISYLSRFLRLLPGDVILTGTPSGVGMGEIPQRFLKEGDILNLSIDHLHFQEMLVRK